MSSRALATAVAIIPIVFVAVITLASAVIALASRYGPPSRTDAPSCEQFVALAMQSTFGNAAEQRHALDRMTPQQFTDASARCRGGHTVAREAVAD